MEASIFTKIINREIPANIIAEDDNYIAFLDVFPLTKGHTLIVPKKQIDYIFDLEDELLSGLHLFSKKVALAVEKTIECKRIGTAVIGLEVPHTHIHLVPINNISDLDFTKTKLDLPKEEMSSIAEQIISNLL